MESVDCNSTASDSTHIPWSYQTYWMIAHGSLESSVAVESSDYPIAEPDPEFTVTRSPLILKPRDLDSGPCEIKICFKQKYEVGQIYVRSTARAYEIYYEKSPHNSNEYFSTVWCGVAERDDKVLQTSSIEDVSRKHGECLSADVIAETASSEGSTVTVSGEDDWVKIKAPGPGGNPPSDKIGTNGFNNIQDLYEATAQISDLDPCLSLTIRLFSLQDKGYVYLDEIYVFVDPVQLIDSGKEAELTGNSAQSSLMAMFMPTLLQLSKSGVSRVQDTYASDEVVKNGKMETISTVIDKTDSPEQLVKPKELGKDTSESAEIHQVTSAMKCVETKTANNFQPGHLETAMEQLISRMSRVEDICLRFEEKMLKPIEMIEGRLQQVENQLEKLAKSSQDSALPHCTRISAPEFSCRESSSSSIYNYELGNEDCARDSTPNLSHDANFRPGLIIRASKFSNGEGDEDSGDQKPLKDSSLEQKSKKTLSVDDALAAALDGFLSTAIGRSEPIQTPIGLPSDVNDEIQSQGHVEYCQFETRESPAAENGNREGAQYAQVFTIKAPDFTAEETGSEEQLNFPRSSLDMAPLTENEKKEHGNEMVPPGAENNVSFKSADSCDFARNDSTNEFCSASNGGSPAVSCLGNGKLNGNSIMNIIETYFEGDNGGSAEISNGSAPNSAKDSTDPSMQETDIGKSTCTSKSDDQDAASDEVVKNGKMETISTVIDKTDSPELLVKPKELGKDTSESAEIHQVTSAMKCVETKTANNFQPGHLETAMERLISRMSRVEDICLRFEEKMLKPIEMIEARLQQVEHQLEKLAKSSQDSALPHCTRISAPEFSCSESSSSSFYNDELGNEDFARDSTPNLSHDANFRPGLIIRAPEFSNGEGDEDSGDLKPLKDSSPEQKPKKTLSVDDALAAALDGFLSTAIGPSEPIQTPIGLPSDVNNEIQSQGHVEYCQFETRESPAAENGNREGAQYTQVLKIKAPDFTAEETVSEEQLNSPQSSLDMAPLTENEKKEHGNEMAPPGAVSNVSFKSADSCDFVRNESTNEFCSASNGGSPAVSCLGNGELNGNSIMNIFETYFEGDNGGSAEISNGSAPNSAKDSTDPSMQETDIGKSTCTCKSDDQDAASEGNLEPTVAVESLPDTSNVELLDLEFPILEVKFTSNVHMSSKSPLEALLVGEEESVNTQEIDAVHETSDLLSTNGVLLDLEVSAPDVSSGLESASSQSSEEIGVSIDVSLI